jgi:hypothetical protein
MEHSRSRLCPSSDQTSEREWAAAHAAADAKPAEAEHKAMPDPQKGGMLFVDRPALCLRSDSNWSNAVFLEPTAYMDLAMAMPRNAPTCYGFYGAPYHGSGYGYYGRQRPCSRSTIEAHPPTTA